jgi:porphobilinogen synthase
MGKKAIESLPGQFQLGRKEYLKEIEECLGLGISTFVLFPVVDKKHKNKKASHSYNKDCFYFESIRSIKKQFPQAILMSDVALDPYNSDGHDGLVKNGKILNDETLEVLSKMSLEQAKAGIDIIGPSDMMDGRVEHIRTTLDENGFSDVAIMSYTAKYASAFYGPFRDALDSAPGSGDKKTYQMDPANSKEALREAQLDELEGADYLMVKPALSYLDIISQLADYTSLPIAAYNVSGEYAMIKAAAEKGWLNEQDAMVETLMSMKRAGANIILTYFAKDYAKLIKEGYVYH